MIQKRFNLLVALMAVPFILMAKSVTVDGVRYTLQSDRSLSCAAVNKKELVNVVIPQSVDIDGFQYYVTKVEKEGFTGCKNLKSIVFPNSIRYFGPRAVWNCPNLESVVMPDEAEAKLDWGNFGYGDMGIFANCKSLVDARGTTVLYPRYMLYDAFHKCENVPFYNIIMERGAANMTNMQMSRAFSEFAVARVKEPVENWQKRKDYETLAQWEARVTDANRRSMIKEATAEARKDYLKMFAPATLRGQLEDYNADYGFFPVSLGEFGTVYASVPATEATSFKTRWSDVVIEPVYGILDDRIAVLSCTFRLGDMVYAPANTYDEDDLTAVIGTSITPLGALREYEQMMASNDNPASRPTKSFEPDVIDIDIPATNEVNPKTFAVIIGNEKYQRVAHVDYAMNDARIFSKYCSRTLGIPEKNIRTYYDATFGDIVAAMDDLAKIAEAFDGDISVIFYYAGHGLPDDGNRNAYLLPIDANGMQTEVCYPLAKLYEQLGTLNVRSVVAFIDACFSGSLRGEGMLASARGIKLRPRDIPATGNLIVLSAASGDQSAYPYHEKNHGLFSYYLLKKLSDTKGDVTVGELAEYISSEVSKQSIVENKKPQTPGVKWSLGISDTWKNIKLK